MAKKFRSQRRCRVSVTMPRKMRENLDRLLSRDDIGLGEYIRSLIHQALREDRKILPPHTAS